MPGDSLNAFALMGDSLLLWVTASELPVKSRNCITSFSLSMGMSIFIWAFSLFSLSLWDFPLACIHIISDTIYFEQDNECSMPITISLHLCNYVVLSSLPLLHFPQLSSNFHKPFFSIAQIGILLDQKVMKPYSIKLLFRLIQIQLIKQLPSV